MKKLFIGILAMALVVGMSMGAMAYNNFGQIEQYVDDSEASIFQEGSDNIGLVLQESYQRNNGNDPMTADVDQTGEGNHADVYQYMNGSSMLAWVTQNGDDNDAFVDQFNQWGGNSEATIVQDGEGNFANIDQRHGNIADITQDGDNNDADIEQGGKFDPSIENYSRNTANVYQLGDDNDADIFQKTHNSIANITQEGNNNNADITQLD